MGLFFGYYPARGLVRLDPSEGLHYHCIGLNSRRQG